jgi:hypothetical protein
VVGKATPHKLKKWLGRIAYALVAAKEFMRYQPFRCVVTINDRETFNALDVRIASGSYQGAIFAARKAKPDNGEIIVYILKGTHAGFPARSRRFRPTRFSPIGADQLNIRIAPFSAGPTGSKRSALFRVSEHAESGPCPHEFSAISRCIYRH